MVDSIKPTFSTTSTKIGSYRGSTSVQGVQAVGEDKEYSGPIWRRVERRSGIDRRRLQARKDPKFEMRRSKGRRLTDRRHPGIETKA